MQAVGSVAPPTPRTTSSTHDLRTLVASRHTAIAVDTAEEERADALIASVARELGLDLFEWTITKGCSRLHPTPGGVYDSTDPAKALANLAGLTVDAIYVLKDFHPHLAKPEVSRAFRELIEGFAGSGRASTIVLLGAHLELPREIEPHVVHYELPSPTREEYLHTIRAVADGLAVNQQAEVALDPADLEAIAGALSGMTINQARQALARVAIDDGRLCKADLPKLIDLKAQSLKDDGLLEYWPPGDNPAELGGFGSLRRWLDRARVGFTPQAAAMNIQPPRGVMLVGVQGCGKSLAAKFVARSWGLPLLKLDMGRLYDKYIGESEKNFRRAIGMAEGLAPAVLWLDEIEKALSQGSGDGGDGGLGRRIFGAFLTWLQEKQADVFVVATANDLSALPPELMRKGRFDEIFFVDLPDATERAEIFRIHLALRNQNPASFDAAALARAADGFSGAEIEQAVIAAALQALHENRPLDTALVEREIAATVPLSRSRAEDVARLRAYAQERFVPVR